MKNIRSILSALGTELQLQSFEPFRAEEDGRDYAVWKLCTDRGTLVLKRTTDMERAVYETFFRDGGPGPEVYAFGTYENEVYMLMEFVPGSSMSHCTRPRLVKTLEALTESQRRWWQAQGYDDVGYGFSKSWPNRCKRLPYMGDLTKGYQAYLDAFASLPRTLCNDDLLPFNVLARDSRAVILDWEYGGMLPYPCALARFLAFGEEEGALFQMSREDRQFALDYYYEHLIREKGISRAEYDRTMDLFFLKEYSEWVYCAALSGDEDLEYSRKYGPMARALARKLGLY